MATESGYTEQGLPWQGKGPQPAHASALGAEQAAETREEKTAIYRRYVASRGNVTDEETANELGWKTGSVNSIRNALVDRGEMTCDGFRFFERVENGKLRQKRHTRWRFTTDEERVLIRAEQQQLRAADEQ